MTDAAQRRRSRGGASQSRAGIQHRFENYLLDHRRNLVSSFRRLLKTPLQSLMTVLVIAIAMALPAALYVGVNNVERLGSGIEVSARMSVFIRDGASGEAIDGFVEELNGRGDVQSTVFVSPDEALEEFQRVSGFGDALGLLESNPLPPTVEVLPIGDLIADPQALEELVTWINQQPIVDEVSLDLGWLQKLHALVDIGRQAALGLGAVLAIGVLLVMGNTIRLAIESRREEILVVKLIGGTNGYVCRPFLYTGLWLGGCAGVMAWLLVWLAYWSLSGEVEQLTRLYQGRYALQGPGFREFLVLAGVGALLGLAGTRVAVHGHMRTVEP